MYEDTGMTGAEGDPKSSLLIRVGIVGTILMLAAILLAQVLFYSAQRFEDERKLYAAKPQELAQLQAEQLTAIHTYRVLDAGSGIVAIPIDRAIELYARDRRNGVPVAAPASQPTTGSTAETGSRP
jgi:hypothetical protein